MKYKNDHDISCVSNYSPTGNIDTMKETPLYILRIVSFYLTNTECMIGNGKGCPNNVDFIQL